LADRGDRAFCDPIVITRDRIVIDGYARWELAKRIGRPMLDCFEYELSSEEDALEELIRTHCASRGLTDFVRIELALDLEPHFREKALMNQQSGGQHKGLSKLTIPQRVNTRREALSLPGFLPEMSESEEHFDACVFVLAASRTRRRGID
jgi:hypothetical protein